MFLYLRHIPSFFTGVIIIAPFRFYIISFQASQRHSPRQQSDENSILGPVLKNVIILFSDIKRENCIYRVQPFFISFLYFNRTIIKDRNIQQISLNYIQ